MDNPATTPITDQAPNPASPNPEQKSTAPKNTPPTQGVGGDQKNEAKNNDVVKENKDITAN